MAKSKQLQIQFIYETVKPAPFNPDDNGMDELLRSAERTKFQPKQPGAQRPHRIRRTKQDRA